MLRFLHSTDVFQEFLRSDGKGEENAHAVATNRADRGEDRLGQQNHSERPWFVLRLSRLSTDLTSQYDCVGSV